MTVSPRRREDEDRGGADREGDKRRRRSRRVRAISGFVSAVLASLVAAFIYDDWRGADTDEASDHRAVVVSNRVTNGPLMREDPHPVRLSTVPVNYCNTSNTCVPGVELRSGAGLQAVCQRQGEVATNGNLQDPADDGNPDLATSTLWYQVRTSDGNVGYLAEVWLREEDRGGLRLRTCAP